jgi:hypothetical protein
VLSSVNVWQSESEVCGAPVAVAVMVNDAGVADTTTTTV